MISARSISIIASLTLALVFPSLAKERPGIALSYQLDAETGELTIEGAESQGLPNLLGDLAPWAALKENQGLKNKFVSSSEGIACLGDLEFMTSAMCVNGQASAPSAIEVPADEKRMRLSWMSVHRLRYILTLIPIEGGSGSMNALLIRNTPTGSALFIKSINCDKNFLTSSVRCTLVSEALKRK
jgi:hypothetical protein